MYGTHDYTFHHSDDGISVSMEKSDGSFRYTRDIKDGEHIERLICSDSGKIAINPVEPLNLPKKITSFLEIEFEPLFIEPGGRTHIYLTFPVEIGVFIVAKKEFENIDIFSYNKPKYSLYGPANGGIITRWAKSKVYSEVPDTNPIKEGVIKLNINNTTHEWMNISRVVFDAYAIKIYYGDMVAMTAEMKIISKHLAETHFHKRPPYPHMKKSIELYSVIQLQIINRIHTMEWGFE